MSRTSPVFAGDAEPACRPTAGSATRLACHADPLHHQLCVPRCRPRRLALQPRASRPCLFAHLQPDQRGTRGAHRRARGRRRAIAVASGQAALLLAIITLTGAGGHIVASRSFYGGSHNLLSYTLPRFGITTTFVDRATPMPGAGPSRHRDRPAVRRIDRQPQPGPCSTSPASRRSRTNTACRWWSTQPWRPVCSAPSSSAPTSWSTRRPSSSVDTALPWAACSSMAAASTGKTRVASRPCAEPYEGFHGMVFCEESPVAAFLLRARRGACATLAPASPDERIPDPAGHRNPPAADAPACGQYARGWCATWRRTRWSNRYPIPSSTRIPTTPSRHSSFRTAAAR